MGSNQGGNGGNPFNCCILFQEDHAFLAKFPPLHQLSKRLSPSLSIIQIAPSWFVYYMTYYVVSSNLSTTEFPFECLNTLINSSYFILLPKRLLQILESNGKTLLSLTKIQMQYECDSYVLYLLTLKASGFSKSFIPGFFCRYVKLFQRNSVFLLQDIILKKWFKILSFQRRSLIWIYHKML